MFQFFAITFGSSFFNMVLGYAKFATAIGFMQNASIRVFVAYIGIVITSTIEWIYFFIIVMNNLFIYMVYTIIAGSHRLEFDKFFLKHYKLNFSFATLVLPGLYFSKLFFSSSNCIFSSVLLFTNCSFPSCFFKLYFPSVFYKL